MTHEKTQNQLYVQETGPASAPTIVFLHGGGGGGWMWQPQVDALPGYHCLVPDLPEHGRSMDVEPFTIKDTAARIAGLIQAQAHAGRAHIVGLSLGAQIGVALLSLAPEVVGHAILSSPLLRPLPGSGFYTPGLIAASYRWFMAPLKNNEFWIRTNMKWAAGVPNKYYPQFQQDFKSTTENSFVHVLAENMAFRLPQRLERASNPVLIVVGKKEYAVMLKSVSDLAAVLPNSRAVVVAHSGNWSRAEEHNWNLKAPELFTATVRAWIEEQPLPEELQPL